MCLLLTGLCVCSISRACTMLASCLHRACISHACTMLVPCLHHACIMLASAVLVPCLHHACIMRTGQVLFVLSGACLDFAECIRFFLCGLRE